MMNIVADKSKYLSLEKEYYYPLFFKSYWMDLLSPKWEAFIIYNQNQEIIGIASLPKQSVLFWTAYRNPIFHPYAGCYFFDKKDNNLENQLVFWNSYLASFPKKLDWLHIHNYPSQILATGDEQRPTNTYSLRDTYQLSLEQSEEELLSNIRSRRRSYIRSAGRQLEVSVVQAPEWEEWLSWLSVAFNQKQDKMPYTAQQLDSIYQRCEEEKNSLLLQAADETGAIKAVLWVLKDEEKAYQMWSAYHPENHLHGAMDLLVWKAWKILKAEGIKEYDFEGSMDQGIARFFKNMGGELYHYIGIHPPQNKILSWLKRIKDLKEA